MEPGISYLKIDVGVVRDNQKKNFLEEDFSLPVEFQLGGWNIFPAFPVKSNVFRDRENIPESCFLFRALLRLW